MDVVNMIMTKSQPYIESPSVILVNEVDTFVEI